MKKQRLITGKEIGDIIKRRRRELGISQQALADELGVSYQQVQRYEAGTNKLYVDNLQQIGAFLQMPIAQFFEGLPDPRPSVPVTNDELKFLKAYRQVKDKGDRALLQRVAKRLASQ